MNLDSASFVSPCNHVNNEVYKWMSIDPFSTKSTNMLHEFRDLIAQKYNFSLIGPQGYTIIFTSGVEESNSMIFFFHH